ncbi:hypothetical protein, conserved [Leishmania tarentolae]|uniref:Uncharacterized protein n=1 Tax=Leishmania tarentolae TaxID=5689 RepID=A0A640KNG0_LEITA|nr:hypothetical protein, conserved [Leishmania tarentolae]
MEAKASRGGEPLLPPRTSVDEPATPLIENSARKAPTASANTARSSPRSNDGDDDHKAPNSIALLSDAAPPSSSIASSSFSMFSQSTMTRRGDEGRKEEGVGKGSAASLVPTLKRLHVLSSSPAATIKRTPSGSIFSFPSQPPTRPEGPLPLVPTAALEVAAAPAFAADPPGSAIGTDAPLHRHPSPQSSAALQPSPPAPVAPVECSAPPAAPETLMVHTAAAVDDKVVDAGNAKCVTGDSKSEDSDTSASHSLRGDDSAPTSGQTEALPNAQRPPALLNECLPATSAEPTQPPLHNSADADADAKRSEGQSNVASGSFHVPPSASASSLRGPPEELPGLLCIAPVEQLSNSRHLSRTDDSGSAESEEAATSGDGGDRWGSKHNLQNTSAHSIEVTVERDEPQNGESVSGDSDARESSERRGQPSGSRHSCRTREWDTEDPPTPPMSASRSQLDHEGSPVCGPLPSSAATLDVGLAMVGVAANDILQQPAAHQHSSSSSSASAHAHSASMKVSTAAPSPMAANTLADSYTMEVSSTQSSVSPAEYSHGSTEPPPSGWPDAVSQVEENKGDDAASTENEALQSSMQAPCQQTQEGRACTRGDVPAKATVDAITSEEIPLPLLLPYATHAREAATAAGAQPPLHPKEYQEETRAETLASSSALPLLSTPAIAVTREGFSPSGGASTMEAPVLSTGVLPAPTHPSPLGPSSSAPGASPPLPLSTTHHQWSPPPPSAVAALAPSFAPAKEAAATFEGHDADCAADMSASAASLAPAAVPAALQPLLASSVLSVPSTNATAADGFTGEAYREECPASLLCIRRPVSVDKVVCGSGSVETAGSLVTPKSSVAQHNRLSLGGTPGNVILGQPPLSMAQFEDRWASSGDDVQHSSDVDDHISRGAGPEGSGSWRSRTGSSPRPRHGYGSRSRSYSYSYDYSYSTGSVTGSTTQRLCPCATVSTPHLHDEGEGAVTGGTTEASDTEVVRLVEYEEVTPVVRGRNGLLGWLCCGRKKATGGVRTSRMEVHRLSSTAEDTRGAHGIGLSALNAGSHKHLPKQEGSATTPLATTEAVRADNAIRSEDTAERKDELDGVKSGGVTGSEGSGPPRGLGSATETPHSSERDISESGDKGLGEAAAYADYRGSTSSYIDDDAPPISQASTLVPPHHEAEETDEGDSGGCSHGEEAEAGPAADAAASQQGRTPPCDIADQASFSSTTSAPFAELGVVVSEDKEASSADGCTEVDGTNDSRDVGVLESADSVPRGDGLALCAVADAVEPHDHHDSGFGCIGGDEVERREEGAATAASAASHPLLPLFVPTEELLHLYAWDAEPPVAASPSCSHQEWEPDRLEAKYEKEAMAAAEEAQQAICQAVQELMVHPPRQCIFVSVHGLRHWCAALHGPQQAPKAKLASGAAAVLAGEWCCAWDGNLQAGASIIEDPRWMDVRLAMYAHDSAGERLLAAGTVFSLPSNLEALRRCLGCSGSGGSIDYPATGGYGRDSWSDLLVFQHTKSVSKGVVQDMQQTEACDYESIVCATAEGKAGHCNGLSGHAPGCRALGCGLASGSSPGSLGGCGVLYVKLEARDERWVSVGNARACAAPTQAGEATSYEAHMHSPVKKAPPDAVSTATTRDGTEGLVAAPEQDEEDTHQSSVGRSTEWSSASSCLPLAEAGAPCSSSPSKSNADGGSTRHSIGATPDMGSVHTRAVNDSGSDERAHETGTRLEERWRPLAVSPPLLPADLCQLQSDQPPLFTALQTMTEAAATAVTCLGKPLPQLPCRLRWAQEPQPQFTAAPEPVPHAPSVERSLTSWVSLETAIKEYERVCRGTFTGAASAATAVNSHLSRPLTVLWNTIPSHLAAGNHQLQEMQKAGVPPGSLQGWCGEEFAPKVHAMEPLTVCSVVMRCTAAILLAHELPNVPGSRYCPPTFLSVTGGCDGVIIEGAAAAGTCDGNSTPITHRAPVMQYNISFHAVLTRDTTSSLLFTVHGAASPADVFGFAVWTPFDDASAVHVQDHHRHGGDADVGGVVDVWLPLFAPASADATPLATTPEEQGNVASSGISFSTVSSTRKGQNRSTTGLVLVGWLHCDVEAVFLPSLAEAAVQKLWNGEHRSLSSLAAAVGEESRHECCMGHGIGVDEDTLVDFTVMEAAGLRPFVTQLGMPSSPTPLRWDDSSTWGNKSTCTHVYCEVLALQRQRQQGTSHRAPRWVPHAAGVLFPAPSSTVADAAGYMPHSSGHRIGAAVRTDFDAMNLAPESYGQGRVAHCTPLRDSGEAGKERSSYDTRTWTIVTGAETNRMLPVTDFVARTNYPRWQHTFRCGLALLSSLYLRVFDLCHHHFDGDGRMTNPQAAVGSSVRARLSGVPERRAMLLGGTTVSSWLLRRLLCRPSGEGCSWLPLLWSPRAAAQPMTASVMAHGKGGFQQHFFPAVCNGFVLVEWRRASRAAAVPRLPCSRESSSWYASVTRRLPNNSRYTTASSACTRSSLGTFKKLSEFPQRWYCPMLSPGTQPNSLAAVPTAYSRQRGWITPEFVPWLRIHELRLQWPWLQHLLYMRGGQARLSLRYPIAQGETRLLAQCLLVPLCRLAELSTSAFCGVPPLHAHSRETCDAAGVYGAVLSAASLSHVAVSPNAAAPAEATLCLPVSPSIEVQVWWYPRNSACSAAGGGLDAPPLLIGRGEWRFPVHEEAKEMRRLAAGAVQRTFEEALNAQPTTRDAAGPACLGDGEVESRASKEPAPLSTALRSFFAPHEADVRVGPVLSTGMPQHVEGGVLTWRLMSVPRLTCDDWGKVTPVMPPPPPELSSCVSGPCGDIRRLLQPSPAAVPASTWAWPDVGTPAVVHVEVCKIICFDHTDGPCSDAAQATAAVQIAVSGTTCVGSPTVISHDESAAVIEARCWMCPEDAPPPEAPRVAYALSPLYNAAADAGNTWSNISSHQQQQQHQLPTSQASWALKPPLRPPQVTAVAGGGEKSAVRSAVPDVGVSRSPTVEVQWPPRRFGWVDSAEPSLSVWVMAPPSLSGGAEEASDTPAPAAAKERVWGAVRLPGLNAFESTSGVLWLPLFQSHLTPALAAEVPRGTAATEDVALSRSSCSDSDTGEHGSATSPPPLPSTVERVHIGVAVTEQPRSTVASGDASEALKGMATPRTEILVKHVGFVAVRYAHNMQRRVTDTVTIGGTGLSAAGPRALLVRIGSLHRRFPVSAAARRPLSPLSSPSFESCTPASEVPLTLPSDAALKHRNAACTTLSTADNAVNTAAATGVLLGNDSGDADVLLGFEGHQLLVQTPGSGTVRDGSPKASRSSGVAVFPLLRRDAGDDSLLQLRLQWRLGAAATMATNTMYFDPGGAGAEPEGAQWVPLIVRRRRQDVHDADYNGEGESVVAEVLVQWRVVDFSADTTPSGLTSSPMSLQRLVQEYCGGGGASCSYTALPALSAVGRVHQSPLRKSCADAQRCTSYLEVPGREQQGQGVITAGQVARALSRVLRVIKPRCRPCAYLTLDQLLVQCSVRQRRVWAALQRGTTASPQEMPMDGGHDDTASSRIRFRLEVQLWWPSEWSAAACLPREAAAFATSRAGTVLHNVWIDSGEGVFVESRSPSAPSASVADETLAYASEERLLFCVSLPPLCLMLPSAQVIDRMLGDVGRAARFRLRFALFVVPALLGAKDSPEEGTCDVCVGTGRTSMASSPSVQFGITSLLPLASARSGSGPPCAGAKDGVETAPPFLRWRARLVESLPVPPPTSSVLGISPEVGAIAAGSGKMGDDTAQGGEQTLLRSCSSSPINSSAEKDDAIEGDEHTRTTGPTTAPLLPCTPALVHATVTRMELCGVDVSLARGAAQFHHGALPPATVTVMAADAADKPTDRRGGVATAASTMHQLLPSLVPLRPSTAAPPPLHAISTPSLPMTRLANRNQAYGRRRSSTRGAPMYAFPHLCRSSSFT